VGGGRVDGRGSLRFETAVVAAGFADPPTDYRASWAHFDNATGSTTAIGETQSATKQMTAPPLPTATGSYVEVALSADSDAHPTWREPIRTYFRRTPDGCTLVGLERVPDRSAPQTPAKDKE